jgi:DNA polymerase-3 subunit delta'
LAKETAKNRYPNLDLRDDGVRTFLDAYLEGSAHPPLLFVGPEGFGKEHTAAELARKICCTADKPCEIGSDLCPSCEKATLFEHPGIHLVYPTPTQGTGEKPGDDEGDVGKILDVKREDFFASYTFPKKVSIRIARARAIIQRANSKPFGASHNVFVIVGVDTMREEAQNALLKILEEPPSHCVVILITESPNAILYTIRSRCQLLRFGPLTQPQIESLLVEYDEVAPAAARKIAALSRGSIQRARSLAAEEDEEARTNAYEVLAKLGDATDSWVIQNAMRLGRGRSRDAVARFLHEFATAYRDVMTGDEALYINRDQARALTALTDKWERKNLPAVLGRIIDTRDQILRRNLNIEAALVDLLLDIKHLRC